MKGGATGAPPVDPVGVDVPAQPDPAVEAAFAADAGAVVAPPKAEVPPAVSVERRMEQDTRDTAALLASQPKVRIRLYQVPEDSTDKPLPDEYVNINGHGYLIQRGVSVDVPQSVAEVLEQAKRI